MKLVTVKKYIRGSESDCNKLRILWYMKTQGKIWAVDVGRSIKDHFTGEYTRIGNYWRTDGIFAWSSDVIYHFEKYNIPLPMEFQEYVLKQCQICITRMLEKNNGD